MFHVNTITLEITMTKPTVAYGDSGRGKTSQIAPFAIYTAQKTGMKTLLVTADGGGYDPINRVVSGGLVDVFDVAAVDDPMGTVRAFFQGSMKNPPFDLRSYGALAVEGLTSLASLFLRDQTRKGRKISQDPVGLFEEQGIKFAAPPPSLYGLVQQTMMDILHQDMAGLPPNILRTYITAHEKKGTDFAQETIYGPSLVGKVGPVEVPPLAGDLLHFDVVKTGEVVDKASGKKMPIEKLVAWFVDHPDPRTGIMYKAKTRAEVTQRKVLMERFPNGYIPLELGDDGEFSSSLVTYWELLDTLASTKAPDYTHLLSRR